MYKLHFGIINNDNYKIIIVENNSMQKETFAYHDSLPDRDIRIRVENGIMSLISQS